VQLKSDHSSDLGTQCNSDEGGVKNIHGMSLYSSKGKWFIALKMEAVSTSDRLVTFYETTRRSILKCIFIFILLRT